MPTRAGSIARPATRSSRYRPRSITSKPVARRRSMACSWQPIVAGCGRSFSTCAIRATRQATRRASSVMHRSRSPNRSPPKADRPDAHEPRRSRPRPAHNRALGDRSRARVGRLRGRFTMPSSRALRPRSSRSGARASSAAASARSSRGARLAPTCARMRSPPRSATRVFRRSTGREFERISIEVSLLSAAERFDVQDEEDLLARMCVPASTG